MLQDSALKSHLYNVTEGRPNIDNFHHFYRLSYPLIHPLSSSSSNLPWAWFYSNSIFMAVFTTFIFYLPAPGFKGFEYFLDLNQLYILLTSTRYQCSMYHNTWNFHKSFSSYLFIEFDKFWLECQPKDIMEFNRIRDLFENIVRTKLADNTTCFKVNIEVDTV